MVLSPIWGWFYTHDQVVTLHQSCNQACSRRAYSSGQGEYTQVCKVEFPCHKNWHTVLVSMDLSRLNTHSNKQLNPHDCISGFMLHVPCAFSGGYRHSGYVPLAVRGYHCAQLSISQGEAAGGGGGGHNNNRSPIGFQHCQLNRPISGGNPVSMQTSVPMPGQLHDWPSVHML